MKNRKCKLAAKSNAVCILELVLILGYMVNALIKFKSHQFAATWKDLIKER